MNEVEPWSTRTREVSTSFGRRIGAALRSLWDSFTDLGPGAWFVGLALVVAGALAIAVLQGRSGPDNSACQQARDYVSQVSSIQQQQPLTQGQAQRLHNASTQLDALAKTAVNEDAIHAIRDVARVAADAQPGHQFSAGNVQQEFDGACVRGFGG